MGPPRVPPSWFKFRKGRDTPFLLLNQSFAAKKLLRLNQYAEPCRELPPEGVARLIVLAAPPIVGLELEVATVNSFTCEIVILFGMKSRAFVRTESWMLIPSRVMLV